MIVKRDYVKEWLESRKEWPIYNGELPSLQALVDWVYALGFSEGWDEAANHYSTGGRFVVVEEDEDEG